MTHRENGTSKLSMTGMTSSGTTCGVQRVEVRRPECGPRSSTDRVFGAHSRPMVCTYHRYMPNKTISVPDDVIPVIESLDVPFSRWVTDQLRRYAAKSTVSFADQLLADAALAAGDRLPDRAAVGQRMERSAPW